LQGLSPQVTEQDYRAGQIIQSLTQEIWVDRDSVGLFTPVFHYPEWIEWADRETGEGIIQRSLDPKSDLAQMAMRGEKRATQSGLQTFVVTEYHNFVALFPAISIQQPVIISCAKTNHKKGRQLLALATYREGVPLFAGEYSISAITEKNKAGQSYFVYQFMNHGWATQQVYEEAAKLYVIAMEAYTQRRLFADQQQREHDPVNDEKEM